MPHRPGDGFYLNVIEGLEHMAAQEAAALTDSEALPLPPGRVRLSGEAAPGALLRLRLPEDAFAVLSELSSVDRSRHQLGRLHRSLVRGSGWEAALLAWRAALGRRLPARPTYRVIAQKRGEHNYRREDLAHAVHAAVQERTHGRWLPVAEGAHLEVWVELVEDHCLVGLRLSDRELRHRTYKKAHVTASLRPTVAAAMVRLTAPRDDDVFCDPMCGAGTLLIERGEAGRYARLIGGDKDPDAIAATRANIGPRYQPIELRVWDAINLPLGPRSVSAMAVNPPFGRKHGSPADVAALYPAFAREAFRVLQPGGRLIVLTDQKALLLDALAASGFHRRESLKVKLLGHPVVIQVAVRP